MNSELKYIDLFCGIGGFRYAIESAATRNDLIPLCVFSSDIDSSCQEVYEHNFKERPFGDITKINPKDIPDHDILLAGFPCQPFSIIGQMKGFQDTRGTLFFEIAKIINEKKPKAFVLENVKLLVGHDKGRTIKIIMEKLNELGYKSFFKVLNALNYGLPQKRERVFIIGFRDNLDFSWPVETNSIPTLNSILEKNVDQKYYVSENIKKKRLEKKEKTNELSIWHENKAGNISIYPYSCALRAGASYNYLLVNGERRLTEREMLRLQGFPESFEIICSYTQTRKQVGNSLPVPVAEAVIFNLLNALVKNVDNYKPTSIDHQYLILEKKVKYNAKAKTENSRKIRTTISA